MSRNCCRIGPKGAVPAGRWMSVNGTNVKTQTRGKIMTDRYGTKRQWVGRCAAATVFVLSAMCAADAQVPGTQGQMGSGVPNQTAVGNSGGGMTDSLQYGTFGHDVMREEDSAYQAFIKQREPAKKIRLADDFLKRYPKSPLVEQVDVGMMNVYRAQQDWPNTFLWADRALALQPNDVDVLTMIGWTIPHISTPTDPDAEQQLSKAETYAKHALDLISTMKKPPQLTESQFQAAKEKRSFQAHSALGIVYFRRDDFEKSAKELQLATTGNATPDPTDLFILGIDQQNEKHYDGAVEAFRECGQIAGPLQDQCKQSRDAAQAASKAQ